MNICFVVLNYKDHESTVNCVNSLLRLKSHNDIHIIIVDNHSENESVAELNKAFARYENIVILENDENTGFARGHNLGYAYAKRRLNADVIICLNNDTYIKDEAFLEPLDALCEEGRFGVIGPDILDLNGKHINPIRDALFTRKQARYKALNFEREYLQACVPFLKGMFGKYVKVRRSLGMKSVPKTKPERTVSRINVVLHGAAVIFMKKYIDMFDDAFYPGTFLYVEEDILCLRCKKYGVESLYCPEMRLIHVHGFGNEPSDVKLLRKALRYKTKSWREYMRLLSDDSAL